MTRSLPATAAQRIRPFVAAAVAAVLVSPLIPLAPAFAADATGTISGTVVDPSGDPSTAACVSSVHFQDAEWVSDAAPLPVESSGRYTLAGLADGTYAVSAEDCTDTGEHVQTWYGGGTSAPSPVSTDEVIVISGGAAVTGIDIQLLPAIRPTSAPSVGGLAVVGETLTADPGVWQTDGLTFSYAWLRNGDAIAGATAPTYRLTADDLGAAISVRVTASAANGSSAQASAEPTAAVGPGTLHMAAPAVAGVRRVGSVLTASLGAGAPVGTTYSYRWSRNNVTVPGATGASYTLTPADLNGVFRVTVTASAAGYLPSTLTSGGTALISTGLIAMARPTIRGNVQLGAWLTAVKGTTSPAGTTWSYRWYRSGSPISGATGTSYRLTTADIGKVMRVVVTATKSGYRTVAVASADTVAVKRVFSAAPVPTIAGTRAVGRILSAVPGTWSPGASLSYQWYRSGVAISRATGTRYVPSASDLGKVMTVTVKGTRSGYATVLRRSGGTARIAAGTISMARPSISGTRRVGYTLSVSRGATSPSSVAYSYQWYRNGKAISGATGISYRLKTVDQGAVMAVKVVARKTGFTTKWSTSYGTAKIAAAYSVISGDGTYRVGTDIKPGTYYTGNTDGCYWERARNFSGDFDAIIDNDFGFGRRMVAISSTDVAFDTSGCGSWRRYDGTGRLSSSMPSDGVFGVNADIRPGLYASQGTSGCYWARLSAASDVTSAIIDNDFASGRLLVQISSSDRFFETSSCGGWTRIG